MAKKDQNLRINGRPPRNDAEREIAAKRQGIREKISEMQQIVDKKY